MGNSALYGNMARYSAVSPTLSNGKAVALQVNSRNALKLTTVLPVGSGTPRPKVKYGQSARYNSNAMTLQDGEEVALQVDVNGNLIVT